MKLYIVSADYSGAYVDSGYLANVNWIAVFHDKTTAQSYVSYLNQNFTIAQLRSML